MLHLLRGSKLQTEVGIMWSKLRDGDGVPYNDSQHWIVLLSVMTFSSMPLTFEKELYHHRSTYDCAVVWILTKTRWTCDATNGNRDFFSVDNKAIPRSLLFEAPQNQLMSP